MTSSDGNRPAVERLISLATVTSVAPDPKVIPVCDRAHRWFLERVGHLLAFDGCLRCFGFSGDELPTIFEWNNSPWRQAYGDLLVEDLFFFAEDVLGNQFAFGDDGIVRFDIETGATERMAGDFAQFAARMVDNPDDLANRWLLNRWKKAKGQAPRPNQHLVPIVPFVAGGEFVASNLYALERYESMMLRGQIADQIKNVPDGTQIRLTVKGQH